MSIKISACSLSFLGLFIVAGCSPRPRAGPSWATERDRPLCFVHRLPGHWSLGRPVVSGLLVAVWDDGRVVRVASGSEVGQAYVRGRAKELAMSELRCLLADNGPLYTRDEPGVPFDAAVERLVIRTPRCVRVWEHSPPAIEVEAMSRVTKFLLDLDVVDESPVEDGLYADYPHDWYAGWEDSR